MTESRQLLWQRKQRAQGRCAQCGEPGDGGCRCHACREKERERYRINYRKKKGYPLDMPLKNVGKARRYA